MAILKKLEYTLSIFDDDWLPENRYKNPSKKAEAVMQVWQNEVWKSRGKRPRDTNNTLRNRISGKIRKYGYFTVLKVIYFANSSLSKYYQYPFSWKTTFDKVLAEFESIKANPNLLKDHNGFLGPIKLTDLSKIEIEPIKIWTQEEIDEVFGVEPEELNNVETTTKAVLEN